MKKVSLAFLSSIFAFFIMGTAVGAEEANDNNVDVNKMQATKAPNIFYDKENKGYYDVDSEGYIEVFKVEDGEVVGKVDMNEYIDRQASDPNLKEDDISDSISLNDKDDTEVENGSTIFAPQVYYRYTESSKSTKVVTGKRSSIIQKNPAKNGGSDTFTLSYSASQGHSFSVTLNSGEKSAVKGNVGYTWSSSASISSSHAMTIKPGWQGYWRFDPMIRISNGTVKQYNQGFVMSSKKVTTKYPKKLNKHLDGELVSVKSKI
ncbi:hypothetical protein QNH23_16985 [Siminovitchia fortis]|uniref:Uncharacterized protein n=2 Tax=Siminovitchia fortis TaxID=254758 RepID=A0A443ILU0_9BACI|nr:hypothetical protein [Siminovitchia fortis]RWR06111.1 hypothetical protein D4N35_014580 [Siminovitchia fortis]WHY81544.1 hypothetical protein QNH23_16985 [Siminovitchia fortis]